MKKRTRSNWVEQRMEIKVLGDSSNNELRAISPRQDASSAS